MINAQRIGRNRYAPIIWTHPSSPYTHAAKDWGIAGRLIFLFCNILQSPGKRPALRAHIYGKIPAKSPALTSLSGWK